jgi:hypothetical protein
LNCGGACSVIGQVFAPQARFSFHAPPAELIDWNASTKSRSSEGHPQEWSTVELGARREPTFQPSEESLKRSVKPEKREMVVAKKIVASATSVRQRPMMGRIIQEKTYKGGYGRKQNLVFRNLSAFRWTVEDHLSAIYSLSFDFPPSACLSSEHELRRQPMG